MTSSMFCKRIAECAAHTPNTKRNTESSETQSEQKQPRICFPRFETKAMRKTQAQFVEC